MKESASHSLNLIIVEDDNELRDILATGLALFGHTVRSAPDGPSLFRELEQKAADTVILDLGLPGEDGISIARRLRDSCSTGIVMVTARGKVDERVLGLDAGADLYFVKPIDIRELDAAIRSLSRRTHAAPRQSWWFEPQSSTLVTPGGRSVVLTANECILLRKLLELPGENVPRRDIFAALRQPDDLYADKRLETMISRLRSKVRAADPDSELPVRARHNLGYAFLAEVDCCPSRGR